MQRVGIEVVVFSATKNEAVAARRVQREPFGNVALGRVQATVGHLGERTCLTVASGLGYKHLDRCFHELTRLFRPLLFVNFGAAGAVDRTMGIGTPTIPNEIVAYSWPDLELQGEPIRRPTDPLKRIARAVRITRAGSCLHDIRDAEIRDELRAKLRIDTTDCETYRLADFCGQRDIPFVALRMITDRADSIAGYHYGRSAAQVLETGAQLLAPLVEQASDLVCPKKQTS
ncbi:MAG TPA: hypothetical protein VM492_16620 [Sumerlaeia bacterium]|nr:hypothetical protein [Sumerlaeia bacterium]